jgi:V-type H+-transporting ATPase subunit E
MSETSRFTEDILSAAKQKAQVIANEAEAETERALEEARAHSAREAEDIVSSAKAEAVSVKRRQISETRHKMKIHEQLEKSKILNEVLEQARKRIMDIVKDEGKYIPYLTGLIENGVREIGLDAVVVHLSGIDLKRVDKTKVERDIGKKLDRTVKIEWSKEPIETAGGAVISSTDGRTRIMSTLDQRLDALESKLLVEAGRILFGQ